MTQPREQDGPLEPATEAAEQWLLCLTSGSLSERELAEFDAWRDADPAHRAAFEEVRDLWNDIGVLEPAFATTTQREAEPIEAQPATAVVDLGQRRAKAHGSRRFVLGGMVAACIALAAVFATGLATDLTADHLTGVGEMASVTLPDGSMVHLNTDSAIALDFSAQSRRVTLLRGEALFEVQKDSARPFDVAALDGTSTAVGTAYNVRSQKEDTLVTVLEGRVRVSADGSTTSPQRLLTQNQQLRYGNGQIGEVRNVDARTATAWRRGLIVIDARPLAEAIAELDRYRPGRILLLADTAQEETVTARIALDQIDGGLDALAAVHGLTVTRLTDYLTILR